MRKKLLVVLICTTMLVSPFFTLVPININAKGTADFSTVPNNQMGVEKTQVSFAAFTDTHIGAKYQYPLYGIAGHLDELGEDLTDATNLLDFAVHLGDIVNHNTAQVNGEGLPWFVNQYMNNLKAFLVSHVHIPFYSVIGNHDVNDYQMNSGDPHNLTRSLVDELSMNNPVYAMMYDGILFLVVPELGYVTWTHPVEYEWITYMTRLYSDTTTIILCHQAIEDTTWENGSGYYRGKQDMSFWTSLFQNNPQIKMWIHGHNHYLDWYVSNQSNGYTIPVQNFGHEIAFSSPYPQMEWKGRYEEDRIVIYNISATSISTSSWEDNGAGGHWVPQYRHSWNVSTTFNPNTKDWYSFPMFLQDNETQYTDMKVLSPDITLQLIGTAPMELFFDSRMESPSSGTDEIILGFGHDQTGNVEWNKPGMRVHGETTVTFPEKYPDNTSIQEDGRSGQPYRSFPMGTICAAVPGQTYQFTVTARCLSGSGDFRMNVSCSDWGTRSQYSMLPGSEQQVFSHTFGISYETIHGRYTVPDDANAWFLQGALQFLNAADYDVSLFSVKRERSSDTTENFHVCLSGHWYNGTGLLAENEMVNFSIDPQVLSDADGVMNFTAYIDGNRYGMVNLIYREPLLLGMNARFRVNKYLDDTFNLSLTKTISRDSAVKEMIWDSKVFERFPRITELVVRLLMKGFTGYILDEILKTMFPENSPQFRLFPFSTDSVYTQVNITADDGSGMRHVSTNGNLWFTCNCPNDGERYVKVIFPSK
jgi:hypothetical protein